jgi:hypothetical protein
MTTRTINDINGDPVEIEIEDASPAPPLDEMIQILTLAKHIYDNKDKFVNTIWLPPYTPVPRKKKKENTP